MNTQITEDYCSFETAKLLKEKGFNEPTCGYYHNDYIGTLLISSPSNHNGSINAFSTPSQGHAMKWLREVHNIDICVCREIDEYGDCFDGYIAVVYSNKIYKVTIRDVEKDLSFEEACEEAIKYCLTNLI